MNKINLNKEYIFNLLLSLVLVTLPFPSRSLNSKTIILLIVFWMFYNTFQEKIDNLKKNIKPFLFFLSLFSLLAVSIFYSGNINLGFEYIIKRLALIVLPLVILSTKINQKTIFFLLHYFSISVLISSLFALLKVWYFKIYNLGNYSTYLSFGRLLEKHTTYFSLFVVITILYFVYQSMNKSKHRIFYVLGTIFMLYILYMLSVRVSVVALVLSLLIVLYSPNKVKSYTIVVLSLLFLAIVYFVSPNFQKRFVSVSNDKFKDISYRLKQWEVIIDKVSDKNLFLGLGLGNDRQEVYSGYKDKHLISAYKRKYNAHNQYIEFYIHIGILGVILFILFLIFVLRDLYNEKLFTSIFVLFLLFMITESILDRHSGLIIFTIFTSLFLVNKSKNIIN